MSVSHLDNKPFLKRVISALEDLNTLDFETIESAFTRLIKNMAHNLSEIVDVYKAHNVFNPLKNILKTTKVLEKCVDKENINTRRDYELLH